MPSEKLSEAIADTHAEIEEVVESGSERFKARIGGLLEDPKRRDLKAWKAWGIDERIFQLTPKKIEKASKGNHDDLWFFAMGGIRAACVKQALVEIHARKLLTAYDSGRKSVNREAGKMDVDELRAHAKIGTPKSAFEAAKDRIKNGATRAE